MDEHAAGVMEALENKAENFLLQDFHAADPERIEDETSEHVIVCPFWAKKKLIKSSCLWGFCT